ncbi:MAG: flagellar protein FliT [Nevskiales bacterium]
MPHPALAMDMLKEVLELHEAFIEAVVQGDWGTATALESRRRVAIKDLLAGPTEANARQAVINALRDILQADRGLVKNLEEAREHCAEQISQLQLGRTATDAYRDTGMMMQTARLMQ